MLFRRFLPAVLALVAGFLSAFDAAATLAADQGVLLRDGDRLRAAITAGDEDAYDLDLAAGGTLQLELSPGSDRSLRPEARLFQPDGTEFDPATLTRRAGSPAPRYKRVRVPEGATGRWQLRLTGLDGSVGEYRVAVRIAPPPQVVERRRVVSGGGAAVTAFAGDTDARVRCRVSRLRGEAPAEVRMVAPDGADLPDAAAAFRKQRSDLLARNVVLGQGLGTYAVVVAPPAEGESLVQVRVTVRFPRFRRRNTALPPEATIAAVTPGHVRQEDDGVLVDLQGSGLLAGSWARVDGEGVAVRTMEITEGGSGRLVLDVAPDAPYGARRVVLFPPNLLGESIVLPAALTVRAPDPKITAIGVPVAKQDGAGFVFDVQGTGFRDGATIAIPAEGVTVGPTQVLSPTLARATVAVDLHAPVGLRDVTITQPAAGGGAVALSPTQFVVLYADPEVLAVEPASVRQEDAGKVLTLRGRNFRAGGSVAVSGTGVTTTSVTVLSDDLVEATVDIASDAAYGARDVTYTHPADGGAAAFTIAKSLTVRAPDPSIATVSPGVAAQLATDVDLVVRGTGFREGGVVAVSGTGLTLAATRFVSPEEVRVFLTVAVDATYGTRTVTYTQPVAGGAASAQVDDRFEIHSPDPVLTSLSAASVRQEDASLVLTLTGSHFRPGGSVTVSGEGVTVSAPTWISNDAFSVTLDVAADATWGARDVGYRQPLAGGGARTALAAALAVHAPDPVVTTVSPSVLRQLDTATLTLDGTGFRDGGTIAVSGTGLTLGATTIVSATRATVQVTAAVDAQVGARTVTFTQAAAGGGASQTLDTVFAVHYPDPVVTAVSQRVLKQEQTGVVLTLTGEHFRSGGKVAIDCPGITIKNPTRLSDTSFQITVDVAADAPYLEPQIRYTQPSDGGGAWAWLGFAVAVHAPDPTVTGSVPTILKQGSGLTLTVTGTGFRDEGTVTVSGAGVTASNPRRVSATTYLVDLVVAADAAYGKRDVTYTQPLRGGGAAATRTGAADVYAPDPEISSFVPNVLLQEQTGAVLTLTGKGYRAGGTVTISGAGITLSKPTCLSDSQFTVTIDVASDAPYGARDLTYTQPAAGGGASIKLPGSVTVNAPNPTIASTSPAVMKQLQSGQTLTVDGTGFRAGGSITVTGDGLTLGTTTIVSATRATVSVTVAGTASVGERTVTYTQPAAGGGAATSKAGALTIHYPDPVLTSASPSVLKQEQTGVLVTLTGAHFRTGGKLAVSGTGIALSNATRISDTSFQVTLDIDANATYGARSVTYTQPVDGGAASVVLAAGLDVRAPDPVVSSVAPTPLVQGTGPTTLTVTGAGFRTGGTIGISGTGLTLGATTFVSPTQATVAVTAALDATLGSRNVTWTQPAAGGGAVGTGTAVLKIHAPTPTVTALTPSAVTQGDTALTVTLTGTNFRDGGSVTLGSGVTVTNPTRLSDTSFRVTVAVASTASLGKHDAVYTHPAEGGGASATLVNALQVNAPPPTVTAVGPTSIKQGQSSVTLTVTGTNFRSGGALSVSGTGLTVGATTVVSDTSATVSVTAALSASVGARDITFTQPATGGSGAATGTALLTILYPDPTVTSVTPSVVEQGTSGTLTLAGTHFRSGGTVTTTGTGVTFSSPTWVSDTSFTVAYTAASNATVSVRDVTYTQPANGGSAFHTKTSAYQVMVPGPTFTSIAPSALRPGDARIVLRIVGSNFNSGTAATFSGSGITVHSTKYVSATTLDADVSLASDAAVGQRNLTITPAAGGGPAKTFSGVLIVDPADPVVTTFSSAVLAQGATSVSVTVSGLNFRSGDTLTASGTGVTFASVTVSSQSTITATASVTAAATTGLRNVTVTHSAGEGGRSGTLANAFRVTGATPSITSVSPGIVGVTGSGGATREVPITITGTNFASGATVSVSKTGGSGVSVVTASEVVVSDTRLDVTLSVTGAATTGLWDVKVTNAGGLGNSGTSGNGALDVKPNGTLAVNRVIASSGGPFGGERVTIQGSGFVDGTSVDFGSVRATGTQVVDASTLVTTVPVPTSVSNTAATSVDVKVTIPAGTSVTLKSGWQYGKDDVRFVTVATIPAEGTTGVPRNLQAAVVVLSAPANASTGVYGTSTGINTFWFESGGAYTTGGYSGYGPGGRFLVITRSLTGNLPIVGTGMYVLDIPTTLRSRGGNAFVPTRLASTLNHDQQTFTLSTTATDTTRPAPTSFTPANATTGQDTTTKIVIPFSEPLNPLTVSLSTITFTKAGTAVPASIALSDDLKTVTITPENELATSTAYTVTVTSSVQDLYANGTIQVAATFTTGNGTDTTKPVIDAVGIESLPSSLDGSGTYVNASGTSGQPFDVYLPTDGWLLDVRFSDAGGAGIDDTTFSAKCSVPVGSASANAELASNFKVTSTGATWRIPSSAKVTTGDSVSFTFTVKDKSGNAATGSTITVAIADRNSTSSKGGDLDPMDARRTWVLRTDLDAFTATYSTTASPVQQGATTTVASNGLSDLDEALRLVGLGTASMTAESAAAVSGLDTGTNAIVRRLFMQRVRELLNLRFGVGADGTRGADAVDVEFLLPGEQGSLTSLPNWSTTNSASSTKSFSEISIGGTNGAETGAYTASGTLGQAWYDPRNTKEEANLNTGGSNVTGIYLLGAFKLQVNSNALFKAKVSQVFVTVHGGKPVGEDASDDDVLAGSFSRAASTDTTKNARYDAIMDAIEHLALYTSAITAHEIGHSVGLVPDLAPKTGLFGAAHYGNTFTEATSTAPNTSNHLDYLGNDLMAGATSFDAATLTGNQFKRFSPMDIAYLLNRLLYDEGK